MFKPVTAREVELEILALPNNKSHGLYSFPNKLLKYSSTIIKDILAKMWPLARKCTLMAFRLQAVCQPFKPLGYPLARNINPFERFRHPFVGNINLFKRLGDLLLKTSTRSNDLVTRSLKASGHSDDFTRSLRTTGCLNGLVIRIMASV